MAAGASQGVASNPWLVNETDETKGLTFGEIKQQQQRIIDGNYTWLKEEILPDSTSINRNKWTMIMDTLKGLVPLIPWSHAKEGKTLIYIFMRFAIKI